MELPNTVFETLPIASQMKLGRAISEREAAWDAYRAASDREQSARLDAQRLEAIEKQKAAQAQGFEISFPGDRLGEQDPAKLPASAAVEAAKRAHQVALDARERAASRQNEFGFLEAVEGWLRRTASPGASFREARPIDLKITARTDLAAEVVKVRSQIAALDEKFAAIENAPVPPDALKARAFAEIEKIAETGAPRVSPLSRSHEPIGISRMLAVSTRLAAGGSVNLVGDAGASFFVWLMENAIKEKISSIIDSLPQNGAMSDDQREEMFGEISAERLMLERIEEALISTAEADGRTIVRRADIDPRAFLCIEA